MKILCLHGYGTSGDIFEQQLAGISAALGTNHEWVFLDGEVHVAKSGMHFIYAPLAISIAYTVRRTYGLHRWSSPGLL